MQTPLFDEEPTAPPLRHPLPAPPPPCGNRVRPAALSPALQKCAEQLQACAAQLFLGCSSWNYPGWAGSVWERAYAESTLSKKGLAAYAAHPLLKAISLDRSFYRPLSAAQYAAYAAQVPADFRFLVKAPQSVTDSQLREAGKPLAPNPSFLDAQLATEQCIWPAAQGLGPKLGAVVFELGPLPALAPGEMEKCIGRLHAMLHTLPALAHLRRAAPHMVIAVEVRDAAWLTPDFVAALRSVQATYCLSLHAKMPRIDAQLWVLRKLWPGPLVARWNLHPLHGAYGYEAAAKKYEPYDRLQDEDLHTRSTLAKVALATIAAGYPAHITISNKAEGSGPLSVFALAAEMVAQHQQRRSGALE